MTSINPIGIGTLGVGASQGHGVAPKKEKEVEQKPQEQPQAAGRQVSPDDVFRHMAAGAPTVAPTTKVDPAKYVDKESQARIEAFMEGFEMQIEESMTALIKEFPGMTSKGAQLAALAKFEI